MTIQATDPPWAVTAEKVEAAIRKIIQVSRPVKIILFGSYVRGATGRDSDVDILVVTADTVPSARQESVRIRRALREIAMPMDILVVPLSRWEELKEAPGLIYREAWQTGKVVYDSPQAA